MKTVLARKWLNYEVGTDVKLSSSNTYYTIDHDKERDEDSIRTIAHKDAIDPSLIQQVPEVGKDYLFRLRRTVLFAKTIYRIEKVDVKKSTIQVKNDNDELIDYPFSLFLLLLDRFPNKEWRFATPEETPKSINEIYEQYGIGIKTAEQKVIDDIWDILNKFKEGK